LALSGHVPVLLREALEYLAIRPEGTYVDCTVGAGGHSAEIARRLTTGRLLALDRDPQALELARQRLAEFGDAELGNTELGNTELRNKVKLVHAHFEDLVETTRQQGAAPADGLLADLGLSRMQLDDPRRGFSFATEGPLDMRMDPAQPRTAAEVVNRTGERELADLIYKFGEERRSRKIAKAIVRARPLRSTKQLAEIVQAVSGPSRRRGLHPATRTFQALRIFVNNELGELEAMLASLPSSGTLRPGARIVVISFHSLEDRIVKQSYRQWQAEGFARILTRHVVVPSPSEVQANPRARSAKLRAAEIAAVGGRTNSENLKKG
jgi:16S rRNA (cytosine1402-N4)-methyltransferase